MPFSTMPFSAMPFDALVNAFVTLIVIIEPVALVPLFLSLTAGMSPPQRREVALRACMIAFAILTGAALVRRLAAAPARHHAAGVPYMPAASCCSGSPPRWCSASRPSARAPPRRRQGQGSHQRRRRLSARHSAARRPRRHHRHAAAGRAAPGRCRLRRHADRRHRGGAGGRCAVPALAERLDTLIGTTVRSVTSRLLGVILAAMAVQFVIDGAGAVIKGAG